MKLVSLGGFCIAQNHIRKVRKQEGAASPFSRVLTKPDIVVDILNDDFKTFLNKDEYIYGAHPKTGVRVAWSADGARFSHSDFDTIPGEHEKLKSQCDYLRDCLSTKTGFGYLMIIYWHDYEYYKSSLVQIRKIIPEDCKLFVCAIRWYGNFGPTLTEDNIYYGGIELPEANCIWWKKKNEYSKGITMKQDERDPDNVREKVFSMAPYGISPEYNEMVDKVFYQ